ncbi:MAG: MFS transporter [Desulfovibrionales bacterium]
MIGKRLRESSGRQVFGWAMYDWANSAYVTTVVVAVLPAYFASTVVPKGGVEVLGTTLSASSIWGYVVGLSALLVFIMAPVLGAVADYSATKKKFLALLCAMGSLCTVSLFFVGRGDVFLAMLLFGLAQIGLVGGNVFYDAFLPQIAPEGKMDWVSGKGFALGYLGGGIQFALSLGLIVLHDSFGISQELAARLAMAAAGLWWGGFALITFKLLDEQPPVEEPVRKQGLAKVAAFTRIGFRGTARTFRTIGADRNLLLFLLAFFLYNDGIQTVINMATIYGKEELGFSMTVLMVTLLIIQAVAFGGALAFGKLAELVGAKPALLLTLVLWTGVTVYAYFMTSPLEYFVLGVLVGLVLGGSQSISRSFFGAMIPVQSPAEFYAFYSVVSKMSSILGPVMFAVVRQVTGTSRLSVLFQGLFFLAGLVLLSLVRPVRAGESDTRIMNEQAHG